MANKTTLDLPEALIAFPNLAKPHTFGDEEPKFKVQVAWPAKDYDDPKGPWLAVKQAIHAVATEKWGDRANQKRDGGRFYNVPFTHGEDMKNPDRFRGYVVATIKSRYEIPLVEVQAESDPVSMEPGSVQKGMTCIVQVKPAAYEVGTTRGVTLYPVAIAVTNTSPNLDFNEQCGNDGPPDPAVLRKEAVTHFSGLRAKLPIKSVENPNNQPDPADVQPINMPF